MSQIEQYKTGGGPPIDSTLSEVEQRAVTICSGQFQPLSVSVDDDAGYQLEHEDLSEHSVSAY